MARINHSQLPQKLLSGMMQTENHLNNLGFDIKLLELMRYRISLINQCAYCVDMHFKEAVAAGESEQRMVLLSVWRETEYYNDKERALLNWAELLTELPGNSPQLQPAFESLESYFSTEEIANLTLAVAQINAWNRIAKAFGFEAGSYQAEQN